MFPAKQAGLCKALSDRAGFANYNIFLNFCPLCKKPLRLISALLHRVLQRTEVLKKTINFQSVAKRQIPTKANSQLFIRFYIVLKKMFVQKTLRVLG